MWGKACKNGPMRGKGLQGERKKLQNRQCAMDRGIAVQKVRMLRRCYSPGTRVPNISNSDERLSNSSHARIREQCPTIDGRSRLPGALAHENAGMGVVIPLLDEHATTAIHFEMQHVKGIGLPAAAASGNRSACLQDDSVPRFLVGQDAIREVDVAAEE